MLKKAIHASVVSRLDCINALLYGLPAIELRKLQKIQNSAARASYHPSIETTTLAVSIIKNREQDSYHCFQMFTRIGTSISGVPKYEQAPMTRSACDGYILKYNWTSLKTARDCSFSHAAPTLWNNLPHPVLSSDSLSSSH